MMRVTIELFPGGDESRKRLIGTMDIALDPTLGLGTEIGNYTATIYKSSEYATTAGVWKKGRVEGFLRRSKLCGPWELLALALQACLGDRIKRSVATK